jgi:RNA polymerase sigma-70 factor (ECF subfamily)
MGRQKVIMESESELMARAREGSKEAFSLLIRQHHSRIRAFLGRYLRRPDVVDDVAQDAFLDAYRKIPDYRGEAPVRYWLLGIARMCLLRFLRDEERRRHQGIRSLDTVTANLMLRALTQEGEELTDHERQVEALEGCLRTLPEHSSKLVARFYGKGSTAVAIARQEGKKESAVWMTLLRIRQVLRRCIESRLKTAEGM